MAFTISKDNIISLTRGDSTRFPLFINQGSDMKPIRYILKEQDEVYFGLMEPNQPFEDALVKKKFTNEDLNKHGDVLIKIDHEDTCELIPGKYFFQVKSKLWNEELQRYEVNTVVKKTLFFIEE